MSQNRPPSPIQPPVVTNPPDSMAQVQRHAEISMPSFLTGHRPDYLPRPLSFINAVEPNGQPDHGRLRLPPIQPPSSSDRRPPPPSSNVFSIKSLLLPDTDSPKERSPPLRITPPQRLPPRTESLPRSVSDSYGNIRTHTPSTSSEPRRYTEDPPTAFRPLGSFMQPHPTPPQRLHYGTGFFDTERPHHSPATSVHSYSRGPYTSSTEPSPVTPAAPLTTFPPRQRVSQPPPLDYTLTMRQQPAAARACGFGERDRRVIDPPPILELKITDRTTGAPEQDPTAMLALHCTLLGHDGTEDETEVPPTEQGMPTTRRLMGTLVASPYQAKDEHGVAGTFFVFPDLSCRSPGKYRLRFKLLRVDPMRMIPGAVHGSVGSITTDIFSVYTAKDFPGMRASSSLLKALRRQGLNVGVKKGSEARKGRGKARKESSSEDEEDYSEAEQQEARRGSAASGETESTPDNTPRSKPKKKGKRRKREA